MFQPHWGIFHLTCGHLVTTSPPPLPNSMSSLCGLGTIPPEDRRGKKLRIINPRIQSAVMKVNMICISTHRAHDMVLIRKKASRVVQPSPHLVEIQRRGWPRDLCACFASFPFFFFFLRAGLHMILGVIFSLSITWLSLCACGTSIEERPLVAVAVMDK